MKGEPLPSAQSTPRAEGEEKQRTHAPGGAVSTPTSKGAVEQETADDRARPASSDIKLPEEASPKKRQSSARHRVKEAPLSESVEDTDTLDVDITYNEVRSKRRSVHFKFVSLELLH